MKWWRVDSARSSLDAREQFAREQWFDWDGSMRYDFFPDREADMINWGRAFVQGLIDRPGRFAVTEQMILELQQSLVDFEEAFSIAMTPETRTKLAVSRKNEARKIFERMARALAGQVGKSVEIDDETRLLLGLSVRNRAVLHRDPPGAAPFIKVLDISGSTVTIRLVDSERSTRRARPDNATGATIFFHVGETSIASKRSWRFLMSTTSTLVKLDFDPNLPPGTSIWISASWHNRRQKMSPSSEPIQIHLGKGVPIFGRISEAGLRLASECAASGHASAA